MRKGVSEEGVGHVDNELVHGLNGGKERETLNATHRVVTFSESSLVLAQGPRQ